MTLNIWALSTGTPTFINQILSDVKSQINPGTVIVGDFHPHCHQVTGLPNRNREIHELNDMLDLGTSQKSIEYSIHLGDTGVLERSKGIERFPSLAQW